MRLDWIYFLKLRANGLKIDKIPKGKDPTIHFQVLLLLVSGRLYPSEFVQYPAVNCWFRHHMNKLPESSMKSAKGWHSIIKLTTRSTPETNSKSPSLKIGWLESLIVFTQLTSKV